MKIAAIEYFPTSSKGGSEKAFFEVLTCLRDLGHQITVFYVIEGNYLNEYKIRDIQYVKIPDFTLNYFNKQNWLNLFKTCKLINAFKPEVIYINQTADSVTSCVCKLLRNVKIVCHIRVPKLGNSRLFNFCGKFIDKFICVNELIKQQYLPFFKNDDMIVINDGIKIKETLSRKEKLNKTATFLGRISPEKGLLELLETWVILDKKYNLNIKLDITGPASTIAEKKYKKELIESINKNKLNFCVNILDPISNPISHLSKYDFSVFPSIIDESFGRSLPESILAGIPVFARKVGIVEEILYPFKNSLIYEKEDELADIISNFYKSEINFDISVLQSHIMRYYDIDKNVLQIEETLR